MAGYTYLPFEYRRAPGLDAPEPLKPVAIIGAGPVGLTLAIDLAIKGIASVLVDDNDVVSVGSRAICWSKRTLEIFDRLGVAERMLAKGVTWQTGRLFHGTEQVYEFDLLPESGHRCPAFINLQQYYVEHYLVERAREFPELIDLRFKNKLIAHRQHEDHVALAIDTPDGEYTLQARYMIACDGANSPTRQRMGLAFQGQSFDEHFLIVDVEMPKSPFATVRPERWFWFEPPFHRGQSALLHKQPDNIYRVDLQLGADADPQREVDEARVLPRIEAITGGKSFTLEWLSVYKFRCAMLERFVHDRVVFAGDSAHVVSPFGARGGNGGIQDADNLAWRLAALLRGEAKSDILLAYDHERREAAVENILHSSRATNFMTPKTAIQRLFRDQVLALAHSQGFARRLINSGRLSQPCHYRLANAPMARHAPLRPGAPALDAPLDDGWLLPRLQGEFTLLGIGEVELPAIEGVRTLELAGSGVPGERYGRDLLYLFRPDGHVAASFERADAAAIRAVVAQALGGGEELR